MQFTKAASITVVCSAHDEIIKYYAICSTYARYAVNYSLLALVWFNFARKYLGDIVKKTLNVNYTQSGGVLLAPWNSRLNSYIDWLALMFHN